MLILAACERSGIVRSAFRARGHNAWSCDIVPADDGDYHHICADVLTVLNDAWDMVIAFPPCTHLASSWARWFKAKQSDGRQESAVKFFMEFVNCRCKRVAIENPVGIMSTRYRKPDQIIQPWQYGHGETKATCWWLRGLPLLTPTNIVSGREQRIWKMAPSDDRATKRSQTYTGIAAAMAAQWGNEQ